MTRLFNRKYQKPIRQRLRNEAPEAERVLWSKLKQSQLLGFKFRKQQGIARYVVDFYCPQCKLAIEIDGATHSTPQEKRRDMVRQEFIEREGVHFLRFTNADVYENLEWVLETIADDLERTNQRHPAPN